MKLLLTGGSGLIGSAVRAECKKTDTLCLAPVHSAYDLKEPRAVLNMVSYIHPTHVIHLAGRVGGIKANMEHQAEFWRDNMMMNLNMLEACRKYPVERMVCCLSTCIFPNDVKTNSPLQPAQMHEGWPHLSNYGYAFAKRNLDIGCVAYNEQFGTKFMRVMPCNCFGPHDNFNLDKAHVIPALIHKIRRAKDKNEPLEVWGSGTALREFVYSHDVARAIIALTTQTEFTNTPVIISPGYECTIVAIVRSLCTLMDFDYGMVKWDHSKPEGQQRKPTDNSLLLSLLPDFKFTPLADALRETVEWFRLNYPSVRN